MFAARLRNCLAKEGKKGGKEKKSNNPKAKKGQQTSKKGGLGTFCKVPPSCSHNGGRNGGGDLP